MYPISQMPDYFSPDYHTASRRFVEAAQRLGGQVHSLELDGLARISHTYLLRDRQVLAWLRQTAQFVLDV